MKVPFNPAVVSATLLTACALAMTFLPPGAAAQVRPQQEPIPNFDKRVRVESNGAESALQDQGKAHLQAQLPSAEVSFDQLLGTPKFVRAQGGFLTGPNGQGRAVSAATARALPANDPYGPVKNFLNEHAALFGHGAGVLTNAKITRESVGAHNGFRTVVWWQQLDGIPVFDAVLIGNITKRGELVTLASQFLPNPVQSADAGTPNRAALQAQPPVTIEQAIVNAAQNLGDTLALSAILPNNPGTGGDGYRLFKVRNTTTYGRLVWLPINRGLMRLSWEVFVSKETTRESFQILIDAETGEALVRRGRTEHISDATYNVYTSDSPSPFSPGWPTPNAGQPALTNRVLVTLSALDTTASPNGWINDGDNDTQGNNVDAFLDRNFDQQPDGPRPQGNPTRVFNFPLDLTQAPDTYTDAATVQLFYLVNVYHDRLYQLGFTESVGNFQNNNFGRGGLGNDRVLAYVQAGANVGIANNASFGTPPDGFSGEMNMFIWNGPTPDRDGSLDAEIVFHEASHGTSQRLVGGGVLISALQTDGMGEGWGDFIGLSLLSEPSDDPDAVYACVGYSTRSLGGLQENYYFGIRHFPYSTDMTKNPFTFKDIDPAQISPHTGVPRSSIYPFNTQEADEVHHQGEIWTVTLLGARANLIRKYGYAGNQMMLQLVIDGMKLGPADPTFLQARDAIILADLVNNGGVNSTELWAAFARRGMGFSAVSPDSFTTAGVVEAFDVPGLIVVDVNVFGGNGNGVIDVNECNSLQVILGNFNKSTATSVRLTLSTTTPGVVLGVKSSAYPDMAPRELGTNLVPFTISTVPAFICGRPITLQTVLTSDQETTTNTIVLNTGSVGSPIRFDSTNAVAIPDAFPPGTNSIITVSNITSALRDVEVSLYLTHTFDFDLRLELIAPDGTMVLLSDSHGGSANNYGASCAPDTSRTTFDDSATIPIANGVPPFIGRYKPDQALASVVGKFGTNVNGAWRLHVVDQFQVDVGVLQCWSLFLSPAVCEDGGGTCPGADLALGIKDVPDPVFIGSNLVYTISVTNNGPSEAKSVVVNQFLPPSVVFVSAVASQGSAVNASGTVVCNFGPLVFGAVGTVVVTVTPTAAGTISSTATVTSSDTDPDTANNSAVATTQVNPPTADLAVGLFDTPDPALVGGTLSYTVSVTNNGPSTASGVTVTNTLPLSVIVHTATPSQGITTINGNVVTCSFGALTNGGHASATITVTPTAQGTIGATSVVSANQIDPLVANNTANATTTVGPAADLNITMVDTPDPVVVRSNWTYIITVTNFGPSTANGVVVNHTLPANVTVVTNTTTQGTIGLAGGVITASLGTLTNGGNATVRVVVNATNSGPYSSTASVTGSQPDQNTGNNSASTTTTVAPPNAKTVIPAGATLIAESILPANGALDVGETVTVQLRLRNAGNVASTNIFATLLATGGVTSPSPSTPTNYGVLQPSDFPVARAFTFTASGTNGGTVVATLQVKHGDNSISNLTFTFALPKVQTFANTNAITIQDNSQAAPYPSSNTVSGVVGLVGNVSVTLSHMSHTFPDDVDMLLLGPNGTNGPKVILMSDAGGVNELTDVTLKLDDTAPTVLPNDGQILAAAYKPADYESGDLFDAPAPPGPYTNSLSFFNGVNPNGVWLLYVMDDTGGDSGNIANGWSLSFTTISPVNQLADLGLSVVSSPNPVLVAGNLTFTYTVTNAGPNAAAVVAFTNVVPAGAVLVSATPSQGSATTNANTVVCNLGSLNVGATGTVTVVVRPVTAGSLTNTANVAASENDLNPANNAASAVVQVNVPVADAAVSKIAATNSVVIGSNVTFTVSVTNNGPEPALNVVVSDTLPAGLSFFSVTNASSFTNSAGTVIANLGDLPSGGVATFTITATATNTGPKTNFATITTTSSDTNAANDTAAAPFTVTAPAPFIVAAGAILTFEGGPTNATVDIGENVTLTLSLQNVGSLATVNLVATLQASGGVNGPSGPQTYGALVPGGSAGSGSFNFTATGTNGGAVVATLQLQDGANNLGTVAFIFHFPSTTTFSNTTAITIPDHGGATPYPSTIEVTGVTGLVNKVTVTLNGVSHGFPDDLDILLVNPTGRKLVLMSDAGGGHTITNLTLNFDDAFGPLPDSSEITAGTYAPTDYEPGDPFAPPAPADVPADTLGIFNATDPKGTWSLYVVDDSTGDAGSIAGWSLSITVVDTVNPTADLGIGITDAPDPIYVGSGLTYSISVTNRGPVNATGVTVTDVLPAGLIFVSAQPSQGSFNTNGGIVTGNLGGLAVGNSATLTIRVAPSLGGEVVNSVSVSANETDLSLANNTAQTSTTVIGPLPITLTDMAVTNAQFSMVLNGEPGLTYVIQASTNLTTWVPVFTNTTGGNGTFKFTQAVNLKQRFYRAIRLIP